MKNRSQLNNAAMRGASAADALVVPGVSRLVRSLVDLDTILQCSDKHGWALVVLSLDVDTSKATGRMVLNIVASVAQWEGEIIGERAAMVHGERKDRSGAKVKLNEQLHHRIASERDGGQALAAMADRLNAEKVTTARGGRWHPPPSATSVHRSR